MKTPAGQADLTFDWPQRERFPLALFGCVFLSLVAHVATFFVFQVIYPQHVTIPPPAPQVELLTASSPENEALLRWIDAEDPALVASAHAVLPATLLEDVPYRASYAAPRTEPRGSTETPAVVRFPPARDPLAVVRSAAPPAEPGARAAVATPSGVTVSEALRDRLEPSAARITLHPQPSAPAEPVRALIGVNDRGEVRFSFLQQSSGQPAFDAEALASLDRLHFAPSAAPLTWGFATVTFGAEAYAAAPPVEPPK